ncbi:MAG: DUF3598 family protein [Cyanobacteria bacterium J06623_5]
MTSPNSYSSLPPASPPSSQWQRLLKNVGTWQGSFTRCSPEGKVLSETPTEVELSPYDGDQAMHQEVRRYPVGEPPNIQTLDYRTLNRATRFFENGAFSQGSLQWGPYSTFGAELGLIKGHRRLRLVQLFDNTSALSQLTLIRERLKESSAPERPQLQPSDLLGRWRGHATTQYANLSPETTCTTQLTLEAIGTDQLRQTLLFADKSLEDNRNLSISSTGTIQGQKILFTQSEPPIQVICLPDGAAATGPTAIVPKQPLFLEVGWLLSPTTRQRLIRRYDAAGAWESLTLVTEEKVAEAS